MYSYDDQKAAQTSFRKRNIILISAAVALVVAIALAGTLLVMKFEVAPTPQPQTVHLVPDTAPRSDEVPFSSHRMLSPTATSAPTTMTPWGVAFDYARGFVWVAEPGCEPTPKCPTSFPGIIGQYALSDGSFIQDFKEPTGYSSPLFLALDKAGHIWFTEPDGDAIGEFDPQSGTWNQWPVKKYSAPFDLTFDTYGNLWFTEFASNEIGFLNPQTHAVVETPTPTRNSNPYGITIDPHGTIWFTENQDLLGQIGSFTPTASGAIKIKEHAVNARRPHLITTDNAGNIWYSVGFTGKVGEFDPRSGNSKIFLVFLGTCTPTSCTGTHISGIDTDSKGNVWFTDALSERVGYLIPSSGQIIARTLTTKNAHPADGIFVDSGDRVWFTEEFAHTLTVWPAHTV
ncbi:MAG TPA: hypothetical protein VFQ30_07190 [Ktedonobacteraceae bacterium]|nr:hypothetical protein [Ktedonobacteraceae bacterium]